MFERSSRCAAGATARCAAGAPLRWAAGAALLCTLAAGTAAADDDYRRDSYVTYAEVVSVTPHYGWRDIEEPVRYCEDVPVRRTYDLRSGYDRAGHGYRRRDGSEPAAGLVGGLIGGLVGHQFGGGNGKKALTIVGAALGASIAQDHVRRSRYGDDHDDRYAYGYRDGVAAGRVARRCRETVETRRVRGVQGYDVTYRYQGRTFNKWMDEHPGDRVRVHVEVEPAGDLALR